MRRRHLVLGAVMGAALLTAACGNTGGTGGGPPSASPPTPAASPAPASNSTPGPAGAGPCQNESPAAFRTCMEAQTKPPPTVIDTSKSYTATVHTARGDFVITLDPKAAPVTVNNFVYLSENHFYDGLTFHRVVAGFVVQGGDPKGDGTGGTGYNLPNETNPAPWLKSSVGMASSSAGVNGAQFFILTGDATYLSTSGVYNHFGMVLSGMAVVTQIQIGDRINGIDISTS